MEKRIIFIFSLGIAFLLIVSPFAMAADTTEETAETVEVAEPKKSPIKIGGAMRVNYAYGAYGDEDNPHPRGEKIGDVDLEIFRLNADLDYNNIISRLEYRWYDGYSMVHTAWLGYNLGDLGTVKAGIVRVPFGPTAYGVSTSWFFDQHFYVGLSDDMDLGVTWNDTFDKLTLDVGFFPMSDPQLIKYGSLESSRYSYDVVKWETETYSEGETGPVDHDKPDGEVETKSEWDVKPGVINGYDELLQFNLRAIYALENIGDFGVSAQYGLLKGTHVGDDDSGNHYAISAHAKNTFADFTLYSQFSYYAHNIADETPWGTGDLIPMGAYDFAWPVASEGLIPALSLRYGGIDTSSISWIDSVTPYAEWSTILKTVEDYNASTLVTLGASWTVLDTLYVYSDLALTDGNFFVGNTGDAYGNILTGVNHVGANGNNQWHWRLNFNFGYYF